MSECRWVLHDASDNEMRKTDAFDSKDDAEAWMGARWSELLTEGAESVSLVDERGNLYYRMGLREE
jgi:hypothetical protein